MLEWLPLASLSSVVLILQARLEPTLAEQLSDFLARRVSWTSPQKLDWARKAYQGQTL
jgi:hypothetical protein